MSEAGSDTESVKARRAAEIKALEEMWQDDNDPPLQSIASLRSADPQADRDSLDAHQRYAATDPELAFLRPAASSPSSSQSDKPTFSSPPPVQDEEEDAIDRLADAAPDPVPFLDLTQEADEADQLDEELPAETPLTDAEISASVASVASKVSAQTIGELRQRVTRWQRILKTGHLPDGIQDADTFVPGFLMTYLEGLATYAERLASRAAERVLHPEVVQQMTTVDLADLLGILASRFKGRPGLQRAYIQAAADPMVSMRDCGFPPLFKSEKIRVIYIRSGRPSAYVGGNVISRDPKVRGRYIGSVLAPGGWTTRGYQSERRAFVPPRPLQAVFEFGTPGQPNDGDLPCDPAFYTYRIANLKDWTSSTPRLWAFGLIMEGTAALQFGGLNQYAILQPAFAAETGSDICHFGLACPMIGLQQALPGTYDFLLAKSRKRHPILKYEHQLELNFEERRASGKTYRMDKYALALYQLYTVGLRFPVVYPASTNRPRVNFFVAAGAWDWSEAIGIFGLQPSVKGTPFGEFHLEYLVIKFEAAEVPGSRPVSVGVPPAFLEKLESSSPNYTVENQIGSYIYTRLENARTRLMTRFKKNKYRDLAVSRDFVMPWDDPTIVAASLASQTVAEGDDGDDDDDEEDVSASAKGKGVMVAAAGPSTSRTTAGSTAAQGPSTSRATAAPGPSTSRATAAPGPSTSRATVAPGPSTSRATAGAAVASSAGTASGSRATRRGGGAQTGTTAPTHLNCTLNFHEESINRATTGTRLRVQMTFREAGTKSRIKFNATQIDVHPHVHYHDGLRLIGQISLQHPYGIYVHEKGGARTSNEHIGNLSAIVTGTYARKVANVVRWARAGGKGAGLPSPNCTLA